MPRWMKALVILLPVAATASCFGAGPGVDWFFESPWAGLVVGIGLLAAAWALAALIYRWIAGLTWGRAWATSTAAGLASAVLGLLGAGSLGMAGSSGWVASALVLIDMAAATLPSRCTWQSPGR